MKRSPLFLALILILTGTSGCSLSSVLPGAPGDKEVQAATQQFLAERGGSKAFSAVSGTVERLEDGEMTVSTPEGKRLTIRLAEDATLREQAPASLADIRVGDTVRALGHKDGGTLVADQVQVGDDEPDPAAGAGIFFKSESGAPSEDGKASTKLPAKVGTPGAEVSRVETVAGTVERIDGETILVRSRDGNPASIRLGENASVVRTVELELADFRAGDQVVALGATDGEVFQAHQVLRGKEIAAASPGKPRPTK